MTELKEGIGYKLINGIAYAESASEQLSILSAEPLNDMKLVVAFSSGEKRLFNASALYSLPVFTPLRNADIFKSVRVEHGVLIWADGEIDIAPEAAYRESYEYSE